MKTTKFIKVICILCIICFFYSLQPHGLILVNATEIGTPPDTVADTENESSTENQETLLQLEKDDTIFTHIDKSVFDQSNHVARLTEHESLDSYVFQNADGTKTVYHMDEAIKYIGSGGEIIEKNIQLTQFSNDYRTTQNNIQLLIPKDLRTGIQLTYGVHTVTMIPQNGKQPSEPQLSNNSIIYPNYYGNGTALIYTPTLSGIKEAIVLKEYTGLSEFSFILYTNGLFLYQSAGKYYLATSDTSAQRLWLGDIEIVDAAIQPGTGTMTTTTIVDGHQYLITMSADKEFLTNPTTVYPVVIDPTVTLSDNTNGSGTIEDAPIYSGYANKNYGGYIYDRAGYGGTSYKIGRTVIRLAGLLESSAYINSTADNISSVLFYIADASGTAATTVNLYPLNSNSDWTESNVTWNNVGTYASTSYASARPSYGNYASFDITDLVKAWKNGSYTSGECGFVLIGANENTVDKAFYSCEHTTTAKRPYVVITYSNETDNDPDNPGEDSGGTGEDSGGTGGDSGGTGSDPNTITLSSSKLRVTEGSTSTLAVSGTSKTINWSSSNTNVATVNSSGVVTGIKAGVATITASAQGCTSQACTVYVTLPDGVYWIMNNDSEFYFHAENGNIANGTQIIQHAKLQVPPVGLRAMWKLKYLDNGLYSIRPMHKLSTGLHLTTGNLDIWDIGTNDILSSIPDSAKWLITYSQTGYIIQNPSSPEYAIMPSNGSTSAGTQLVNVPYTTGSTSFLWTFEKNTSPPNGIILYNATTGIHVTNATLSRNYTSNATDITINLIPSYYSGSSIDQTVFWSSTNNDIASVNNGVITVHPHTAGGASIICRKNVFTEATYNIHISSFATLLAYDDGSQPRNAYISQTKSTLSSISSSIYTDNFTGLTEEQAIGLLENTSIFYVHTHGLQSSIDFGTSLITMSILQDVNLSKLKFALLLTCYTGQGGYSSTHISTNSPVNIVEQMVCSGAKTVVGFSDITYVSECNSFATELTKRLFTNKMSTAEAIDALKWNPSYQRIANLAVIGGDGNSCPG